MKRRMKFGTRLLLIAIVCTLAVFVVDTIWNVTVRYTALQDTFASQRAYLVSTTAHSMSLPLYDFEEPIVGDTAAALFDHPAVVFVSVVEPSGGYRLDLGDEALATHTEATSILSPQGTKMGQLTVGFSGEHILQELRQIIISDTLVSGFVALILSAVILFSLRAVLGPLTDIQHVINQFDGTQWSTDIPHTHRNDELGALARAYRDMAQQITGFVSDLEKKVEERTQALVEAHQLAEEMSLAKSAFIANMSHEVRTPMNGVLGMAQALRNTPLSVEQQDQLDTIINSGWMLMNVMNDLLDLSRIDAGQVQLSPSSAKIEDVFHSVVNHFRPHAEKKGLTLTLNVAAALPEVLLFDVSRVKQCVSNCLSHALQLTEEGEVKVNVGLDTEVEGQSIVRVEVIDTGIGIAPEVLRELFQDYGKGGQAVVHWFGGTGLGITIARKLAELMGGQASAESTVGEGSKYSFTFMANPCQNLPSRDAEEAGRLAVTRPCGLHVLVVDDNIVNRKVACAILASLEATSIEAENGQEALDILGKHQIDLVLLDIQMPVMDGNETIKRIRSSEESWHTVPVVALTAEVIGDDREKYLAMGMDEYATKPISRQQLFKIISTFVGV